METGPPIAGPTTGPTKGPTLGLAERLLRRDRQVLIALILLLIGLSAVYTLFGVGMRMSALNMTFGTGTAGMGGMVAPAAWGAGYTLLVFAMWWVMMTAMMLPSVAPTVLLNAALLRQGSAPGQVRVISLVFLVGYLLAWGGVSAVATLVQWALESAQLVSPMTMSLVETTPGALLLIAAGAFQFTPLKTACLSHCRSPVEFLTTRRRKGGAGALAMGLEHGLYCLGCCWSLMALLFVGGIMNLYWIVGLAVFVAVEKLTRAGDRLGRLAGAALIGAGVYLLVIGA
ncbi:DUF2182 domain-containing protein [Oceanibium sediminis]|uniref:DUF2182 domain-containing protein n=1 Tax=Oceanibium sediminis TaxID=2026339 RepID=UPI000DD36C1C|nr:DUF2182 domain-containing protein [Oceanibium sediminis]